MISRRALLVAVVLHACSARIGNAEDRSVVDLDPASEELVPLFEEISKWIKADKLKPVSFTLVAWNAASELNVQLLVHDRYGKCEVFQKPPKDMLLKLEKHFTSLKNEKGNPPRLIFLGKRANGEYWAQDIDGFSGSTLAIRCQTS